MFSDSDNLTIYFGLVLWAATLVIATVFLLNSKHRSFGFSLAYLLSLTVMHGGAIVYLNTDYNPMTNAYLRSINFSRETVAAGLEASALGFAMLALGMIVGERFVKEKAVGVGGHDKIHDPELFEKTEKLFFAIGAVFYLLFFFVPFLAQSAGIGALVSVGRNFFPLAICVALYRRMIFGQGLSYPSIAVLTAMLPMINLLTTGILADAVATTIIVLCAALLLYNSVKKRIAESIFFSAMAVLLFFFLAFNYMQTRQEMRQILWSDNITVGTRISAVTSAFTNFRLPNPSSFEDLYWLDMRMNHSLFVGKAVKKLERDPTGYEGGATLAYATVAWIPRVVWPDKPRRGGSVMVTKHTGYVTRSRTTLGIGPFFEGFVNFGYLGVLGYCFIYGMLIRLLEVLGFRAFRRADLGRFAAYSLSAIALVSPLAAASAIFTAAFASLAIGLIAANRLAGNWKRTGRVPSYSR